MKFVEVMEKMMGEKVFKATRELEKNGYKTEMQEGTVYAWDKNDEGGFFWFDGYTKNGKAIGTVSYFEEGLEGR